MKKILITLIVAVSVLSCGEGSSKPYVIDGDTIDVNGTRIRFARIDAYELDTPKGRDAKWFLIGYVKNKNVIFREVGIGYYKRTIAEVYADGINLSDLMVREGHAIYKHYNN